MVKWDYFELLIVIIYSMTFNKVVVIDARGHLQGRLASYVAKQLLNGTISIYYRTKNCCSSS